MIGNVIIANSSKQINATEENEILYTNAESPIKNGNIEHLDLPAIEVEIRV